MPALLLIAAAAGIGLLVFRRRGPTKADGPKLRELSLTKLYLVRDINVCAAKLRREERRFTGADVLGVIAAMGTVAAGGDFKATMTAARLARAGGGYAGWGHKDIGALCPGVREKVAAGAKRNDELSAELGLDPNLSVADVQAVAKQVGASLN